MLAFDIERLNWANRVELLLALIPFTNPAPCASAREHFEVKCLRCTGVRLLCTSQYSRESSHLGIADESTEAGVMGNVNTTYLYR